MENTLDLNIHNADREILRQQLRVLAENCKETREQTDIANATLAMCEIYKLLYL